MKIVAIKYIKFTSRHIKGLRHGVHWNPNQYLIENLETGCPLLATVKLWESYTQGKLKYTQISTINMYFPFKWPSSLMQDHVNYIEMEIFKNLLRIDISKKFFTQKKTGCPKVRCEGLCVQMMSDTLLTKTEY